MRHEWRFAGAGAAAIGLGVVATAAAHDVPARAHGGGMETCEGARPVLSVGDFDGSGVVDGADVKELAKRITRRDDAAFFDVEGDGDVDMGDLLVVAQHVGAKSTPLDQEIAAVFRATERYRDIHNAIDDGFVPMTTSFQGHGVHWGRNEVIDTVFSLTRPEGLNYSEDGKLLAVFWAIKPDPRSPDVPPSGFTGEEMWHSHQNACFFGYNAKNPTYDFRALNFQECVPEAKCPEGSYLEKFYMVHLWLFEYDPCGPFAGTNPRIRQGARIDTSLTRCPAGHAH